MELTTEELVAEATRAGYLNGLGTAIAVCRGVEVAADALVVPGARECITALQVFMEKESEA